MKLTTSLQCFISTDGFQYKYIPTQKGKYLLMLNEYTFSQDHYSTTYYCSKKSAGCKATVKLNKSGTIREANTMHTHEPPRYMQLASGEYVRVS